MSIEAITWALNHSSSAGTTRCVLIALANGASPETSECFPSLRRLARQARCGETSVKRAVRELERMGEVIRSRRHTDQGRDTSNGYLLPHVPCGFPELRVGRYDQAPGGDPGDLQVAAGPPPNGGGQVGPQAAPGPPPNGGGQVGPQAASGPLEGARLAPLETKEGNQSLNSPTPSTQLSGTRATGVLEVPSRAGPATGRRSRADLEPLIAVWNANRGELPACTRVPSSRADQEVLRRILDEGDGNLELIGEAFRAAAQDDHYQRCRYGIVNVGRHFAARWRGLGEERLAERERCARMVEEDRRRSMREEVDWLAQWRALPSQDRAARRRWVEENLGMDLSALDEEGG